MTSVFGLLFAWLFHEHVVQNQMGLSCQDLTRPSRPLTTSITYTSSNKSKDESTSLAHHNAERKSIRERINSLSYSLESIRAILASSNQEEFDLLRSWIEALPEGKKKSEYQRELLEAWIKRDSDAAENAAFELSGVNGEHLRKRLFQLAPRTKRGAIFERMSQSEKVSLINEQPKMLAKANPAGVIAALGEFEDIIDRDRLLEGFLRTLISGGADDGISLSNPAENFEQGDPHLAAEIVHAITDPELRDKAAYFTAYTMSELDSERAANWLNSIPKDRFYDMATLGFIEEVARYEAGLMLPWADSIQDPEIRSIALESVKSRDEK